VLKGIFYQKEKFVPIGPSRVADLSR